MLPECLLWRAPATEEGGSLTCVHGCSGRLERPSTIAEFARLVYSTLNTVSARPSFGIEYGCVILNNGKLDFSCSDIHLQRLCMSSTAP